MDRAGRSLQALSRLLERAWPHQPSLLPLSVIRGCRAGRKAPRGATTFGRSLSRSIASSPCRIPMRFLLWHVRRFDICLPSARRREPVGRPRRFRFFERSLRGAAQRVPRGSGLFRRPVTVGHERLGRQAGAESDDDRFHEPMENNGKHGINAETAGKNGHPASISRPTNTQRYTDEYATLRSLGQARTDYTDCPWFLVGAVGHLVQSQIILRRAILRRWRIDWSVMSDAFSTSPSFWEQSSPEGVTPRT